MIPASAAKVFEQQPAGADQLEALGLLLGLATGAVVTTPDGRRLEFSESEGGQRVKQFVAPQQSIFVPDLR